MREVCHENQRDATKTPVFLEELLIYLFIALTMFNTVC